MFVGNHLPERACYPGFVISVHFYYFLFCKHFFIEFYVGIGYINYFIYVTQILSEDMPVCDVKLACSISSVSAEWMVTVFSSEGPVLVYVCNVDACRSYSILYSFI